MLIEFRVENHRSLRDEQVLTMEAGRVGDGDDQRPRTVQGLSDRKLLTVAGLYGPNASGKSNVLAALAFMRDAIVHSHRLWPPEGGVPREQFGWGSKKVEPSKFEATLLIEAIQYEYGFVASDTDFLREWLYAWPNDRKQVWFEREGKTFKFGDNLKGENKVIEEVTRPNALFLSAAVQHKHQQLNPIYSWFQQLQLHNFPTPRSNRVRFVQHEMSVAQFLSNTHFDSDHSVNPIEDQSIDPLVSEFYSLLRNADIGIVGLKVQSESQDDSRKWPPSLRVLLKHKSDAEDSWLPLEEESKGTRTLYRFALPILRAIQRGSALVVDELESSLHPALAERIVRQFNDLRSNPKNAQLIFTTHDTNLIGKTLGEPALRRDQTWLTEKDPDGATELYPLTDFKPRKSENLERGYLQGRYGAIPFLDNFMHAES